MVREEAVMRSRRDYYRQALGDEMVSLLTGDLDEITQSDLVLGELHQIYEREAAGQTGKVVVAGTLWADNEDFMYRSMLFTQLDVAVPVQRSDYDLTISALPIDHVIELECRMEELPQHIVVNCVAGDFADGLPATAYSFAEDPHHGNLLAAGLLEMKLGKSGLRDLVKQAAEL